MSDIYIEVDGVKYVRQDQYDKLEQGAVDLAHKYEKLLDLVSDIKTKTNDIHTQQETDSFSDLTQKHNIPY